MKNTPSFICTALAGFALIACGTRVSAATIAYVGAQNNVDPAITTSGTTDSVGWRNTTTAKTYDIDGDNVIGSDGFYGRGDTSIGPGGSGNLGAYIPSYISNVTRLATGGNNFGYQDDPLNPGNNDYRVGFWGVNKPAAGSSTDLFTFAIQGSSLAGQTLSVAIEYGAYKNGDQSLTLTQTAGSGTGTITSPLLSMDATVGYDWAYFTIDGATSGDQFTVTGNIPTSGGAQAVQWSTVAFDTAAVPEPSACLLGLAGGLLLLRRRRA